MSEAAEPLLDLSEIVEMYKADAFRMVDEMRAALAQWNEVAAGGPAQQSLRRLSHQLRGSGRTYGFRRVTRISKAIEHVMIKIEKKTLTADKRVHQSVKAMVEHLATAFNQ